MVDIMDHGWWTRIPVDNNPLAIRKTNTGNENRLSSSNGEGDN